MSDPLTAISGVSAGSSLIGGLSGSRSAKRAANAQVQGANASIEEQQRQYDQARADTAPYRASGEASNRLLDEYLGTGNGTGGTAATAGFTPLSFEQWSAQNPQNNQNNNQQTDLQWNIANGFGIGGNVAHVGGTNGISTDAKAGYQQYLNANPATAGTNGTQGIFDQAGFDAANANYISPEQKMYDKLRT